MTRREWLALAAQFVVAVVVMFALWGSILALAWAFDAVTSHAPVVGVRLPTL